MGGVDRKMTLYDTGGGVVSDILKMDDISYEHPLMVSYYFYSNTNIEKFDLVPFFDLQNVTHIFIDFFIPQFMNEIFLFD